MATKWIIRSIAFSLFCFTLGHFRSLIRVHEKIRNRDEYFEQQIPSHEQVYSSDAPNYYVADILSIGSKRRPELLVAQQESFASHISVRHFFNATEQDDEDDPHCDEQITADQVYKISRFCRQQKYDERGPMMYVRNQYASIRWLKKKANPVGWMCAQRRPLHGLYKVIQHYLREQDKTGRMSLPDYLIIMDDDTYMNMEQFQRVIPNNTHSSVDPIVTAGCLVRLPMHYANFTFGFGGYGIIFNEAALRRLMEPIECPSEACAQVKRNLIGEEKLFQNGMSVAQLIRAFVMNKPFVDSDHWKDAGYCMHSDWVMGYFVNWYNLSQHSILLPAMANVPQDRMETWQESQIYYQPEGFCKNEHVQKCQPNSVTCHYMTAKAMVGFTNVVRANVQPGRFRH